MIGTSVKRCANELVPKCTKQIVAEEEVILIFEIKKK
jgi:hypothetical protein